MVEGPYVNDGQGNDLLLDRRKDNAWVILMWT